MRRPSMGAEKMSALMSQPLTPQEAHELLPGNWGESPKVADAAQREQKEREMVIARQEVAAARAANRREALDRAKERFVGILGEQERKTG